MRSIGPMSRKLGLTGFHIFRGIRGQSHQEEFEPDFFIANLKFPCTILFKRISHLTRPS
jgi:hypothetical protein